MFASLALLGFSTLTGVALIAWFEHRADDVWTWKAVVALLCAILGVTTSALLWRAPTSALAKMGGVVMLFSLVRIGLPQEWTWRSFSLVAVTLVLLIPLVHAASVLKHDD